MGHVNWFYKLLGFKEKQLPPPGHEEPIYELPGAYTTPVPLDDVFLEAIQESYDEEYKLELQLLNDAKLRQYVKNSVKAMTSGLTKDSYDFILIHPSDAKIDAKIWKPFAQILIALCKEIGLPAEAESGYINVKKKDVKKAFDNLKKQVIDIDERTRAMLSQGIYR